MNSKKITLSIIVPVYNVEKYIANCLDSIKASVNTYDNEVEIVIVNDGTTDSSIDICKKYISSFKHMTIINQKNKGLSGARNTGISKSNGKYLLFLDSDDMIEENAIKNILQAIYNNGTDIILGKAIKLNNTTKEKITNTLYYSKITKDTCPVKAFTKLDKNNRFWFAAWLLIVKRELVCSKKLYFKEGIYHEDELWVPYVMSNSKTISYLEEPFYIYRTGREGSIITKNNPKKEFDKIIIIDELEKIKKNKSTKVKKMLSNRQASLMYGLLLKYKTLEPNDSQQLMQKIKKRTKYLRNGKYVIIYYKTKLFGL